MAESERKQRTRLGKDRKQRRIDPRALAVIEDLVSAGAHDPDQILHLVKESGAHVPHRKTVLDIVREWSTLDDSGPWSLADGTVDEARAVLPFVATFLSINSARADRLYLTKAEARWVVRVDAVAHDLHPIDIYRLARAYLAREKRDLPTSDLDALLSIRPWETEPDAPGRPSRQQYYQRGVTAGSIPKAPPFFLQELAGMKWRPPQHPGRAQRLYLDAVYFSGDPDAWERVSLPDEGGDDAEGE